MQSHTRVSNISELQISRIEESQNSSNTNTRNGSSISPIQQMQTHGKVSQYPFQRSDNDIFDSRVTTNSAFSNIDSANSQNLNTQSTNNSVFSFGKGHITTLPMSNNALPPMTESERSIELNHWDQSREITNKTSNWQRIRKKEYPLLGKDYLSWRTLFLTQAQVHGMHEIYEKDYVPRHIILF